MIPSLVRSTWRCVSREASFSFLTEMPLPSRGRGGRYCIRPNSVLNACCAVVSRKQRLVRKFSLGYSNEAAASKLASLRPDFISGVAVQAKEERGLHLLLDIATGDTQSATVPLAQITHRFVPHSNQGNTRQARLCSSTAGRARPSR